MCVCMCMLVRSFAYNEFVSGFLYTFIYIYRERESEQKGRKIESSNPFPGLLIMRPLLKANFSILPQLYCVYIRLWACVCVYGALVSTILKGVCFCMLFVLEM